MSICFVMGGIWIWVAGELGKSGGVIEEETVIRKYCMKKIYFQVEKIEKKISPSQVCLGLCQADKIQLTQIPGLAP